MFSKSTDLLKGIIVPMITPLKGMNELDVNGLERLIEHILSGGVHGLFILGTTGEAPNLSYDLRYELIKRSCAQVSGRVPVFVGITDTSFVESVKLTEYAYDCGADAAVVAPPYYLPIGQAEFIEYIEHLTERLPLPTVLYNMPGCTKFMIEQQTVCELADVEAVIGLKDSSGNMVYFHKIKQALKDKPDFNILIGPEELIGEALIFGADGGVNGGANMFPKLYAEIYNQAKAGNIENVRKLHELIITISSTIYSTGSYSSSIVKGTKCVLDLMGICDDFMAEPFHRFRQSQREQINKHLNSINKMYNQIVGSFEQSVCYA